MFTLVIGGAASGKSEYAEGLLLATPGPRYYLATMEPAADAECCARIRRHRALRAGKGFVTVERAVDLAGLRLPAKGEVDLAGLRLPAKGDVLLEDLGNLAANELYSPAGAGPDGALRAVVEGVVHLRAACRGLVVVSNEIFAGGRDYAPGTEAYLRLLADAHRALAAEADSVCEVACGLPIYYKGAKP